MLPVRIGSGALWPNEVRHTDQDFIVVPEKLRQFTDSLKKQYTKVIAEYPVDSNHRVLILDADFGEVVRYEFEIAYLDTTSYEIAKYCQDNYADVGYGEYNDNFDDAIFVDAPRNILWLLKESHKYKDSVHFEKTRKDVLELRSHGYILPKHLEELLARREKETYRKPIKLNVSKDEFFSNDGVSYLYDHDWLHEILKTTDKPAYMHIKDIRNQVHCSKKLWDACDDSIKKMCVIEEAMVIALERGIVPYFALNTVTKEKEYEVCVTALQKICTSLTSGWFREFAWLHYDELKTYIKNGIDCGDIQLAATLLSQKNPKFA